MKGIRMGLVGIAAVAALLFGGAILGGAVFAQDGDTVGISDGSAETGESGDVTIEATDISEPGLGAWTLDIHYDTSVITATDCTAEQGGVCNRNFADGVARITGATAGGLEGDSTLGTFEFECGDDAGTSDLDIQVSTFADATLGDPTDIDVTVVDGTFTCSEEEVVTAVPAAGTGFSSDGTSYGWLVALLAVIGTVGLAVGALRNRAR